MTDSTPSAAVGRCCRGLPVMPLMRPSATAVKGASRASPALSFARTMRRRRRRNEKMDIGGWLQRIGLERYEQAFRDHEIDLRVLPELTVDDLDELDVAAIGHRRV